MSTRNVFLKAYSQHKSNAKNRGIEMRLTFKEWKKIWLESGKWNERGRLRGQFCMCRFGDLGHYELNNVFIGQGSENVSAAQKYKAKSSETRQRISESNKGVLKYYNIGVDNVMHRPEVKAKISAALSGGNHYRARRIKTPYGEFPSGTVAAKSLGIPKPTVYWRCKYQVLGWSFLT